MSEPKTDHLSTFIKVESKSMINSLQTTSFLIKVIKTKVNLMEFFFGISFFIPISFHKKCQLKKIRKRKKNDPFSSNV